MYAVCFVQLMRSRRFFLILWNFDMEKAVDTLGQEMMIMTDLSSKSHGCVICIGYAISYDRKYL